MNGYRVLRWAGAALLCAAFVLTVNNIVHAFTAGQGMDQAAAALSAKIEENIVPETYPEEAVPDYILNPDMEMPTEEIDGREYIGKLSMPGFSREFPVLSDWSYDNLSVSPCRYAGTAYKNDLVILAHNYPGQFDFLKDMVAGDAVTFTDVDGNEFCYQVVNVRTLRPEETDKLYESGWDLSLFTCNSTGTARLLLDCAIVES